MTNAQKWIAAFLGLFLVLLLLGRITKKDESNEVLPQQMGMAENTESVNGLEIIKKTGCVNCHGSDLQGTRMAPALTGIKENWNKEKLIGYLRNPSSYESDSRFADYKEKYKGIVMPSYNNLDVKDLGKIAEYLLSK